MTETNSYACLPNRPSLVYFGLFDNCNARCNMCRCWQLPRARLSVDHYRRVLDAVLGLRPEAIRFTGGEPLLFPQLSSLARAAADAGTRVSVISNGRLLARRVAELAAAGCAEIVLSVDGMASAHDRVRNKTWLFQRCAEAIEIMAASEITYGVNTVLQRQTIGDVSPLATWLFGQRKPPAWWHHIPVRGDGSLSPTDDQLRVYRQDVDTVRAMASERAVKLILDPGMFEDTGPSPCDVPQFAGYVRADTGDIFGCNMLVYDGVPLGNLLRDTPESAWYGQIGTELRADCAAGRHAGCARCDLSSRGMNHFLRDLVHIH